LSSYHLDRKQTAHVTDFIESLNKLLRDYNMTIEFSDGALFSELSGYLGQLEDNNDHIVLGDGEEDIIVSTRS
jgi:hypothetical protein